MTAREEGESNRSEETQTSRTASAVAVTGQVMLRFTFLPLPCKNTLLQLPLLISLFVPFKIFKHFICLGQFARCKLKGQIKFENKSSQQFARLSAQSLNPLCLFTNEMKKRLQKVFFGKKEGRQKRKKVTKYFGAFRSPERLWLHSKMFAGGPIKSSENPQPELHLPGQTTVKNQRNVGPTLALAHS